MHTKLIFLFLILIYSFIFMVLEVRLTKYQQIHPDTTPAAQHMITFCCICNGAPLVPLIENCYTPVSAAGLKVIKIVHSGKIYTESLERLAALATTR